MKSDCCGSPCVYESQQSKYGPCWGKVEVIDEIEEGPDSWSWVHACDGHADLWLFEDGNYKPEPTKE